MQACPEGLTPRCLDWYTSIHVLRSVAGWQNAAVVVSAAFTEARSLEVRIVVKLVVNAEQAKVLTEARESVEILDPKGNRLGFFARPFSEHEIELARSRAAAGQPGRSTAAVLERLGTLGYR